MPLQPYLRVLRVPRVRTSMLLMFGARLPMTSMGITLTLHVVSELGMGYAAAGLVGTATMAGTAIGAPLVGRVIDRKGLRFVLAVTGAASAVFWLAAPHLPYVALLIIALPAGMLTLPSGSISRQVLTALVAADQRRSAFALDSMATEVAYMSGPTAGIMLATQLSSEAALSAIGVAFGLLAAALFVVNPPVRSAAESTTATRSRYAIRDWLGGKLLATLLIASGALFVLVGTELAVLATLRESGDTAWTGLVIAVMCLASLTGGAVHGTVHRSLSQLSLLLLLAVLVIPVGLIDHPWWLLALALIPTNLACAPTLASTTESVSALAPAQVRGTAMGLQDSATRLGLALGSPVVGFVIDHAGPVWGFAASGVGGLLFAAAGVALARRARPGEPAPTPVRTG